MRQLAKEFVGTWGVVLGKLHVVLLSLHSCIVHCYACRLSFVYFSSHCTIVWHKKDGQTINTFIIITLIISLIIILIATTPSLLAILTIIVPDAAINGLRGSSEIWRRRNWHSLRH